MIKPSFLNGLRGRESVVEIDPQPSLPVMVLVELPPCLTYATPQQLDGLIIDPTEDAHLFTPYRLIREDVLNGFLSRLNIALQYQNQAQEHIEQLLRQELHRETEEDLICSDPMVFDSSMPRDNASVLNRAKFRHDLAYALYAAISGNGLYRNGYLFYQIRKVLPTAIVLTKLTICV